MSDRSTLLTVGLAADNAGGMGLGLHHSLRAFLTWAMLLPFLLLSLLSPAVMPFRGANGTVALVLCTGDGPIALDIDPVTGAPVDHAPDSVSERCDWAASHHAVIDLARPALPPLAGAVMPGDAAPVPYLLAASSATGLPPATGPPSAA